MTPRTKTQTTKDSVPASSAMSGTVTTNAKVFSVSVADDLQYGDWVLDLSQNEVRRVVNVNIDGEGGELDEAFTSDLSAATVVKIDRNVWKSVISISVAADFGADVPIWDVDGNSSTIKSGSSKTSNSEFAEWSMPVAPIIVDGATGNATVTYDQYGL